MGRLTPALLAGLIVTGIAGLALAQSSACTSTVCGYLPLMIQPEPTATIELTSTPQPTDTPTPLPPSYNNCQDDPNANLAPNYPIRIVSIDKAAETVTLRNVSSASIDLTGWQMCSITGNQHHPISGTLGAGATTVFPNTGGSIWNNSSRDDGALYDPEGHLVSYLVN